MKSLIKHSNFVQNYFFALIDFARAFFLGLWHDNTIFGDFYDLIFDLFKFYTLETLLDSFSIEKFNFIFIEKS